MFWDFIYQNYVYILMPVISGLIGWITNVLAVKMTFYPIDYFGIRPFGWQGIIPSKTTQMAEKSVDLLTRDLFKTSEVFARIDTQKVTEICSGDLNKLCGKITSKVMRSRLPLVWSLSGAKIKSTVSQVIETAMPSAVQNSMQSIKDNVDSIIDLKKITIDTLKQDKTLINKIFLDLGGKQFRFIETSGLFLGAFFGIGQIFTMAYTSHWLMFLLYGIFIGYITNYLAIKLIFEPAEPIQIGPFVLWGLFLKRQKEEAFRYAQIISERILTIDNLFDTIFRKDNPQIKEILGREISTAVDRVMERMPAPVRILMPDEKIREIKSVALFELMCEMPLYIRAVFPYAEKALDIQNTIGDKMANLPPKKFIGFLRPAFEQDEWKLIAVGAALGGAAGIIQYIISLIQC